MATEQNGNQTEKENGTKTEKKGLVTKVYGACKKAKDSKTGRVFIRIGKGIAITLGLYGSYKLGQKSMKPTTVYISEGVQEEEPEAEEAIEDEQEQD